MMSIAEKTFIRVSVGTIGAMLCFTFAAGDAYQKFNELQGQVISLRVDFNKYVIDRNLKPMASNAK